MRRSLKTQRLAPHTPTTSTFSRIRPKAARIDGARGSDADPHVAHAVGAIRALSVTQLQAMRASLPNPSAISTTANSALNSRARYVAELILLPAFSPELCAAMYLS